MESVKQQLKNEMLLEKQDVSKSRKGNHTVAFSASIKTESFLVTFSGRSFLCNTLSNGLSHTEQNQDSRNQLSNN